MNERAEEISPPMKPSSWILPQINKLNEKSTKSTLQCSHCFSTQRDLCVLSQQKTIQQNSDRNWGHLLQIHQVPHLGDGEISQVVLLMLQNSGIHQLRDMVGMKSHYFPRFFIHSRWLVWDFWTISSTSWKGSPCDPNSPSVWVYPWPRNNWLLQESGVGIVT